MLEHAPRQKDTRLLIPDLSSVLIAASAIALMLGVGMLQVGRVFGHTLEGVAPLAGVSLCFGFACACFAVFHAQFFSSAYVLLLGNLFIFACAALFHLAICALFERSPRVSRVLILSSAALLAGLWYTLFEPLMAGRAVVFSIGLLGILLLTIRETWINWHQRRSSGSGLMLVVQGALILAVAGRIVLGAVFWREMDALETRLPADSLIFLAIAASFVSAMLMSMVLISQRALVRLRATTAREDLLTGLANRSAMLDLVDSELDRCALQGLSLSLLLIEIDNFRQFNDWYGHTLGDRVLVHVAQSLQARLRSSDYVGRWGGASFLVVLPGSGVKYAQHCADRLVHSLRYYGFQVGALSLELSVCVGIVTTRSCESGRDALISEVEKSQRIASGRVDGIGSLTELD